MERKKAKAVWADLGRRKDAFLKICACLLALLPCLFFFSCSCNGEKKEKGGAGNDVTVNDDDSTPTSDDSTGDDETPPIADNDNNDELPVVDDGTADDAADDDSSVIIDDIFPDDTTSDDDSTPVSPTCQNSETFKVFPDAYDKVEDIPCNAWEPRPGCEPPDIPLVLVKYTPKEFTNPNDQPDEWPYNDSNITWMESPKVTGTYLRGGLHTWSLIPNSSPVADCGLIRLYDTSTHSAYEIPCVRQYPYSGVGVVLDQNHFAISKPDKPDYPASIPWTYLADLESSCQDFLEKGAHGFSAPMAASSNWVLTNSYDIAEQNYSYRLHNVSTGESYVPAFVNKQSGAHDLSDKYVSYVSPSDNEDESQRNYINLFNVITRENINVPRDPAINKTAEMTRNNGGYLAFSYAGAPSTHILFHIPSFKEVARYNRGGIGTVLGRNNLIIFDQNREGSVGEGSDIVLIDLATLKERYITEHRVHVDHFVFDEPYIAFTRCSQKYYCDLFLWDLEKAGFLNHDGKLIVE